MKYWGTQESQLLQLDLLQHLQSTRSAYGGVVWPGAKNDPEHPEANV